MKRNIVFRSNVNKILRKSERDHCDNVLTDNKSNLKIWSVTNEIINKRKHESITSKFVAKNAAAKILDNTKEATSYIKHSNIISIFLGEVSTDEISKVINCLKTRILGGMISIPRLNNVNKLSLNVKKLST